MKKILLLALSLFPTIALSYSFDDLEEAIENSDLKSVRSILNEVGLSERDRESFLMLSHDVLCKCKSDIEVNELNEHKSFYYVSSRGPILIGLGPVVTIASIVYGSQKPTSFGERDLIEKRAIAGFFSGIVMTVAGFILTMKDYLKGIRLYRKDLQNNYDNALKIKQLILRSR